MPTISKLVESLVAAAIQFAPPGYSHYSQVPITYCDEVCQQTPVCDDPSKWNCKPPTMDSGIYQEKLQELLDEGHSFEMASFYAKPLSYTRPETYEEGLVRYQVIGEAVVKAALQSSQRVCKQQCKQLTDEKEVVTCHHSCNAYAPWKWSYKELAYLTLTVWGNESGFRGDVHGGVGPDGRGDCGYLKAGKQVAANTPGATRFCKSVCLGQANVGMGYVVVAGQRWYAKDLVGIDLASTYRCAMATMSTLARARGFCTGPMAPATTDWAGATLSMYGTGNKCDAPNLMARSKGFHGMMLHTPALPQRALDLLKIPEVTSTVSFYQNISPVLWPIQLDIAPPPQPPTEPKVAEAVKQELQDQPTVVAATP